ncbi:MAG: phospholipase [Gammaproteobacteria bacterium]|nr:phospholipase [Gammaproteobacteria bacterium]
MSQEDETETLLNATTALVPPLLTALDALSHAGRHLHPPNLTTVVGNIMQFQEPLRRGLETFDTVPWPDHLQRYREHLTRSAAEALQAFDGLAGCTTQRNPAMGAYRAMSYHTRAVDALYPVSFMLPPVSRFFLNENYRENQPLLEKLAAAEVTREEVGIIHAANEYTERGGFSLYVPEYYDGTEMMPLVVALHGGSGHGRSFLWTWLRDARTRGVILVSPTSREGTWSLMGPDVDSANLEAIVAHVCRQWQVDQSRMLITGMSDGGTFSFLNGLGEDSIFTHLAPVSASFHPLLLEGTSGTRLKNLPVYLVHGVLDWMFEIDIARVAEQALTAAGAAVTYREIADLSHTYPREENARILDWLIGG